MSQTENTPDLGAMISQLLADPQRMQQLGQMAASLGLGAPAQSSSNETASCGGLPDLSAVLGAAPNETNPVIDPSLLLKLQSAMQSLSHPSPSVELLRALRPLLSAKRAKKVDDAVRIMQLVQLLPTLKEIGLFRLGGDSQRSGSSGNIPRSRCSRCSRRHSSECGRCSSVPGKSSSARRTRHPSLSNRSPTRPFLCSRLLLPNHTQPAAITRSRKHNLYLPQMQTAVPCWIFFPSNGTSC